MTLQTLAARGPTRRSTMRLLVVAAVLGVGLVTWFSYQASHSTPSTDTTSVALSGSPAPTFSLRPVGATQVPKVSLAGARGHPVMLSFFASWCDGCQQELTTMHSVVAMAGRSVRVIGIDVNDSDGPATALLRRDHITYPVGADPTNRVTAAYRLVGLPTTVFLDSRHREVGEVYGPLTTQEAAVWLRRIDGD